MIVKTICNKCKSEINWTCGKDNEFCPKYDKINIRNVTLAEGEVIRLFQ